MSGKKSELRQKALNIRRSIRAIELESLSETIEARLRVLTEYANARTVATYVARPDEVQTASIIRHSLAAGRRILVPKTDQVGMRLIFSELRDFDRELAPGQTGILEPRPEFLRRVDLAEAELVLVPVVGWDERGYRLGYGAGYFDRALAELEHHILTIGLGLEAQRFDELPVESHDVPLEMIVTEERVVRTGEGKSSSPNPGRHLREVR